MHHIFGESLGAITSSLAPMDCSHSPGFQLLSTGNNSSLIPTPDMLRLIVTERNCSLLQGNSKGEKKGNTRRKGILVAGSTETRKSHDLHSNLTNGPESPSSSLVPHLPSQILFEFAQEPRSKKQRESPAGWQRILLGFLKPEKD